MLDAAAWPDIASAVCEARASSPCACPRYTEGSVGKLEIKDIHRGAFTGPGRDEAVVALSGCESGASSSFTYGGRTLLRRTSAGWIRLVYTPGALGQCIPIVSAAGIARLVCHAVSGHMGYYEYTWAIIGYDETRERRDEFLDFWTHGPDASESIARICAVRRFDVLGREAYAKGDVRALSVVVNVDSTVRCVRGASSCADAGVGSVPITLRFEMRGDRLEVAPEARAALALLAQRAAPRP
jgi:hypothetical protein